MNREKFNQKALISIVTTAYNESKVIEQTILSWNKWLKKNNLNSEIIVYDDGSTDNTSLILKKIQKKILNFKFLTGKSNKGYGYGMRQAIKIAKGKYLVTIDSDNQYDLSNIKKFFSLFDNKIKCVTGFRHKKKDSTSLSFFNFIWMTFPSMKTRLPIFKSAEIIGRSPTNIVFNFKNNTPKAH